MDADDSVVLAAIQDRVITAISVIRLIGWTILIQYNSRASWCQGVVDGALDGMWGERQA
jgi:hypothetical protein